MWFGGIEELIEMVCFLEEIKWSRDHIEIIFCKQANSLVCFPFFLEGVKIASAVFSFLQEAGFRSELDGF